MNKKILIILLIGFLINVFLVSSKTTLTCVEASPSTECSTTNCNLHVNTTLNNQGVCLADNTNCPASIGDTNETTRFDELVLNDCDSNYLVVGIETNGSVKCDSDDNTGGTDTNATSICGAGEILLGDDEMICVDLNTSYLNTDTTIPDTNVSTICGNDEILLGYDEATCVDLNATYAQLIALNSVNTTANIQILGFTSETDINTSFFLIENYVDSNATSICGAGEVLLGDDELICADLNASYLNTDTDTNESARVEELVLNDCGAGYLIIGIESNGSVKCAVDSSSASTDTNVSSICGNDEILLGYDEATCVNINNTYATVINLNNINTTANIEALNFVTGSHTTDTQMSYDNIALTNETKNFTLSLFINETSCDTVDTNAEGLLVCGSDSGATDTNESTRIEEFILNDCGSGYKAIGMETNGSVICSADDDTDTVFTFPTNVAFKNETNTFTLNQTLSDELILSQDKNIYMGVGKQYYNGSCVIIKGSTSTLEIC